MITMMTDTNNIANDVANDVEKDVANTVNQGWM